jgi:hypothetical protein
VIRRLLLLGAVSALHARHCPGQSMRTFTVTRPVAAERFLHVTLDFGGGTVVIVPAPAGELYGAKLRYDADRSEPAQAYDARTGILHLGVVSIGSMGVRVTSRAQLEQAGRFEFSPDVPLALDATLGASDATIDLGGLTLTQLELRSTATHATVDFSQPTRGSCKSATFTVGAADLNVHHLAQAGCESLRVDGGVGSVALTFDGAWRRDLTLVVDLALGSLTLQLPRGTGVQLTGERFLAPFDSKGFVRTGDTWTTPGFDRALHKLTVELKASMVGIDVQWIDQQ